MTIAHLQFILSNIGCRDYLIGVNVPMESSDSVYLFDATEPRLTGAETYDAGKHLPKPFVRFDRTIFRDFVCVVPLRADIPCDDLLAKYYWGVDKIVVRASWRY